LELLGAEVLFKNSSDYDEQAKDTIPELFVVFELNYSSDSSLKGSTICFRDQSEEVEKKSRMLAEFIQSEIVQSLGSDDRGVVNCSVGLESLPNTPAVIIKPLYVTNQVERSLLSAEIFRQKIAVAVFDGISRYLRLF
jgi:N-acetylmuramoyl-L-alanine amidase